MQAAMKRGALGALAAGILIAGVAAAPAERPGARVAPAPSAAGTARPNIVVIMSDDQDARSLRSPARAMRNVRRVLAGRGTTFESSFASYPLCCPSRATYLTGQYSHNHGVEWNRPPVGGYEKFRRTEGESLPVWLERAGYHTIHIGKYLNGYGAGWRPRDDDGDGRPDPPYPPKPAGWTTWNGSVDPFTYRFWNYWMSVNGTGVEFHGARDRDYSTDVYTRKAVRFIESRRSTDQPFFLSLAYLAPHTGRGRRPTDQNPAPAPRHAGAFARLPLPAPPSFNERDISDKPAWFRAAYRDRLGPREVARIRDGHRARMESLLAVDEGVAAVVNALRRTGKLENTWIVYTADNGYFHGEHRIPLGKVFLYEESARVPLVVRPPGDRARSQSARDLVANIDLAPTIVDLSNATAGRRMDGVSLLPFVRDPRTDLDRDLLIESGPNPRWPHYDAIRTERHVFAQHVTNEGARAGRELYDLRADPFQQRSLVGVPRFNALEATLARRLAALRTCAGASCG